MLCSSLNLANEACWARWPWNSPTMRVCSRPPQRPPARRGGCLRALGRAQTDRRAAPARDFVGWWHVVVYGMGDKLTAATTCAWNAVTRGHVGPSRPTMYPSRVRGDQHRLSPPQQKNGAQPLLWIHRKDVVRLSTLVTSGPLRTQEPSVAPSLPAPPRRPRRAASLLRLAPWHRVPRSRPSRARPVCGARRV